MFVAASFDESEPRVACTADGVLTDPSAELALWQHPLAPRVQIVPRKRGVSIMSVRNN